MSTCRGPIRTLFSPCPLPADAGFRVRHDSVRGPGLPPSRENENLYHGRFVVLADLRKAAIQPLKVVDALEAMMPKASKATSAPIAAVVASHLAKLQTERYPKADNCRTFLDIDETKAWLAGDGHAA